MSANPRLASVLKRYADAPPESAGGLSETRPDPELIDELAAVYEDAYREAYDLVAAMRGIDALGEDITDAAEEYGRTRAAELVTNIDETTRDNLKDLIAKAEAEGTSDPELADTIDASFTFDEGRGQLIARTESATAYNVGTVDALKDAGEEYVFVTDGDLFDEECQQIGSEGQIWTLEEAEANPLGHPNCQREFRPLTAEELAEVQADEGTQDSEGFGADFDESKHPRDEKGRFAEAAGTSAEHEQAANHHNERAAHYQKREDLPGAVAAATAHANAAVAHIVASKTGSSHPARTASKVAHAVAEHVHATHEAMKEHRLPLGAEYEEAKHAAEGAQEKFYSEDQAREPAGSPEGGRWTRVGDASSLGGTTKKEFYEKDGEKYLFKPDAAIKMLGAEAASQIARLIEPGAIDARMVTVDGRTGLMQQLVPGAKPLDMHSLEESDIWKIQQEQVLDWITSQHDSHPGQFIRDAKGNVVGTDKSQAWKHFPEDRLHYDYHPNAAYGERPPIYNTLFRPGSRYLNMMEPAAIAPMMEKISKISYGDVARILKPYADRRFGDERAKLFIDHAYARITDAPRKFASYYSKLLGRNVKFSALRLYAEQFEAEWDESKHPRDEHHQKWVSADTGSYSENEFDKFFKSIAATVADEVKAPPDPKALPFAEKVLARAKQEEPAITASMQASVKLFDGSLARMTDPRTGLPTMTKGLGSLQRKIGDMVRDAKHDGVTLTYEQAATQIGDSVRYTALFPDERFTEGALGLAEHMKSEGWRLTAEKNYFGDHNPYRGVNLNFSRGGLTIEVQVHTQKSLDHAERIHPVYEVQRRIPGGSTNHNYRELARLMTQRAIAMHLDPPNWDKAPGRRVVSAHFALKPGWSVRFFKGSNGIGLYRWDQNDEHLFLTQLDRESGTWVDSPPLLAVMGIGGVDRYTEISSEEAEKLADGVEIWPEGSIERQKFEAGHDVSNQPRDDHGRWTDGGDDSAKAALQNHLVDFKVGDRALTGPDSKPITEVVHGTKSTGYLDVPGIDEMHDEMGLHPTLETNPNDYQKARDALFEKQPLVDVRIRDLTFTQPRVNVPRTHALANLPEQLAKPVQVIESGGRHYLMNGHHRVAAAHVAGQNHINAHVLHLGRQKFEAEWDEAKHPRVPAGEGEHGGEFTHAGEGGGGELSKPSSAYPKAHPEAKDTQGMYSVSKGVYTPERAALHKAIRAEFLKYVTPVESPVATVLGGGGGAGKTTTAKGLGLQKGSPEETAKLLNTVTVNTDLVREKLPEMRERLKATTGPVDVADFHEEASDITNELLYEAARNGYNVLFDSTGDGDLNKMVLRLGVLRGAGYVVNGVYVTVPTDVARERAHARAKSGSDRRLVPDSALLSAHIGVSERIPAIIKMGTVFNHFSLYDTEAKTRRLVATADFDKLIVHNQKLWDQFRAKAYGGFFQGRGARGRFAAYSAELTTDDIITMLVEIETGKPPSLRSPEADRMRAELTRECADIKAQGFAVEIPSEIPAPLPSAVAQKFFSETQARVPAGSPEGGQFAKGGEALETAAGMDTIAGMQRALMKGKLTPEQDAHFALAEQMEKKLNTVEPGQALFGHGPDPDTKLILDNGKEFSTSGWRKVGGLPQQCHWNAARLFAKREADAIGTGYALSDLGIWYQHSWGLHEGKILETTVPFKRYFGVTLTDANAMKFAKAQGVRVRAKKAKQ